MKHLPRQRQSSLEHRCRAHQLAVLRCVYHTQVRLVVGAVMGNAQRHPGQRAQASAQHRLDESDVGIRARTLRQNRFPEGPAGHRRHPVWALASDVLWSLLEPLAKHPVGPIVSRCGVTTASCRPQPRYYALRQRMLPDAHRSCNGAAAGEGCSSAAGRWHRPSPRLFASANRRSWRAAELFPLYCFRGLETSRNAGFLGRHRSLLPSLIPSKTECFC